MKLKTQRGLVYEIDQSKCTKEQLDFLKSNMGSRRYIWNKYVELYKAGNLPKDYSYKPITNQMEWAKELDSCMFDNVKRDFKTAIKNHKTNPGHYGEPKFKRKKIDEDRYKNNKQPSQTR